MNILVLIFIYRVYIFNIFFTQFFDVLFLFEKFLLLRMYEKIYFCTYKYNRLEIILSDLKIDYQLHLTLYIKFLTASTKNLLISGSYFIYLFKIYLIIICIFLYYIL